MPSILVNDVSPVVSYVATASQTLFSVPFEFFNVADIVVQRQDVTLTYSASPANNNQYSVTGAGAEGGGSITLGGAGATLNDRVVIYRDVKIERLANYPETGPMSVRSLNAEQSKHIAMMQQLERDLNRGVVVPIDELAITLPSAATRANKILSFDATGNASTTFSIASVPSVTPVPILGGGTSATTAAGALTALGAYAASNPSGFTSNTGTVTSVATTGSVNGLTLTGSVTTSGTLTLGGSITSVATTATINGAVIGYRSIPRSTTTTTAVVGDVGKCIAVSAGITIPNSTFAAGDAVSIYNDSAAAVTITAGVTTLRLAGTTTTGNRTLAARGMATVWFNSATEAVISGAGVT